jgi:hypothetical protein
MKALKFLGNRVEDAANAFIDVLKYSDQSVDYPDFKDIEPWPEDIVNMFKDALKDKPFSEISALKIAWNSEIETIGNYKKIMNSLALYSERADYDDVMYLLNKLVADEEHHIKLLKEAMGMDKSTKGVTVIIK